MRRMSVRNRLELTALLVLIVGVVIIVAMRPPLAEEPGSLPLPTAPGQMMTLDPQIIANLTQYPQATPLAGQEANDITALRVLVDSCADFDSQRRGQMDEQIDFILHPASLPSEALIALGANPHGRLLYAIANLTSIQWQLIHSPASSCLVPIGKRLNQFLVADKQPPISAFEGG